MRTATSGVQTSIVNEQALYRMARDILDEPNNSALTIRSGSTIDPARARLVSYFGARLEVLDRACGLSEAQKAKLQLAATGDLKRYFDRVGAVRRYFADREYDPMSAR